MAEPVADIEQTNMEVGNCDAEQPDTDGSQPRMTLTECANLARNLYALENWLRDHSQP